MAKYFRDSKEFPSGDRYTTYTTVSDKPKYKASAHDEHVAAELTVRNAAERPLYVGAFANDPIDKLERYMREDGHSTHEDIGRAIEQQKETPQLLYHSPARIDRAFSDPSMKFHMGTLIGQAINEHKNLVVTDSLSRHSSRLAKKGIEAGVVTGHPDNPSAEVSNDIEFVPLTRPYRDGELLWTSAKPVPQKDVDAARRTMHNLMRPKPLSPQFETLQRFETEASNRSAYNPSNDPNAMKLPGMED